MQDAVRTPECVRAKKEQPRDEREAFDIVCRVDLIDLWHERERCPEADCIHEVIEIALESCWAWEGLQTFSRGAFASMNVEWPQPERHIYIVSYEGAAVA